MARAALKAAKAKLSTNVEDDVLDAALRLRMAMEALTYERAMVYAEDLGPDQMKIWQPKQLMNRMLEVDPQADQDATFSVGLEPSYGETPEIMTLLGTDKVLKLSTLKEQYDALGSFLHTPTLGQLEKNKVHDMTKLRVRCDKIIEAVEIVLSSHVWSTAITNTGAIACDRCGYTVRRRILTGIDSRDVECWECKARYTMTQTKKGQVEFKPLQVGISCASLDCQETTFLWKNDFRSGTEWDCHSCGTRQRLALGVTTEIAD